jgi:hypothetical protein
MEDKIVAMAVEMDQALRKALLSSLNKQALYWSRYTTINVLN